MNVPSLHVRLWTDACFITFEVYLEAGHDIYRAKVFQCVRNLLTTRVCSPLKAKIVKIHLVTSLFLYIYMGTQINRNETLLRIQTIQESSKILLTPLVILYKHEI